MSITCTETGLTPETRSLLPDTTSLVGGVLALDGLSLEALAGRYGTPLYVYDEQTIRNAARATRQGFDDLGARVSFASKACDITGIMRVLRDEKLELDVVSEGEIVAGLRAGFRPEQIHLHGNCKSDAELEAAARLGLHAVVVDNLEELDRLRGIADESGQTVHIMPRVTLSIEARTHPHLQTSGYSSKFGISRGSSEEATFVERARRSPRLRLMGIHAHLGSQITDPDIYAGAAGELLHLAADLRDLGFPIKEVSVGGGWAVAYAPNDPELTSQSIAQVLHPIFNGSGFRLAVEPGRSLVARAGLALYRIGSVKQTPAGRIIAVDGGMGDNPRPALYGSGYIALRLRQPAESSAGPATIAGRYCESGDVLARSVELPEVHAGDILCIPMSGAYHLSMASHYNLVPEPAVVLVHNGHDHLIVRRATIDDLLARQMAEPEE